jgi:mono/diheme cytochrome c family protein
LPAGDEGDFSRREPVERGGLGMNRGAYLGFVALLATGPATTAVAQTPVERGSYLVNTVMTCHNCHTPMGPNGPQFDKALSGGLRFNEPPFDVTGSNLTPDPETGLGKWSDADFKAALLDGVRPSGHHLAEVMPTGFYKILTPGDLDGKKLNEWIGELLKTKGNDIYRMKGVLSVKGSNKRLVFQGVHMLFDAKFDREWQRDENRTNTLVFIGKNLDRAALTEGMERRERIPAQARCRRPVRRPHWRNRL